MRSSNAVRTLEVRPNERTREIEVPAPKEEIVPPWRVRLRWWLEWLVRPSSIVRLVGPQHRPLERHEFEIKERYEVRNRVL